MADNSAFNCGPRGSRVTFALPPTRYVDSEYILLWVEFAIINWIFFPSSLHSLITFFLALSNLFKRENSWTPLKSPTALDSSMQSMLPASQTIWARDLLLLRALILHYDFKTGFLVESTIGEKFLTKSTANPSHWFVCGFFFDAMELVAPSVARENDLFQADDAKLYAGSQTPRWHHTDLSLTQFRWKMIREKNNL